MADRKNGTVTVEVEQRLEDLFREEELAQDFAKDSEDPENSAPEAIDLSSELLEDSTALEESPPRELEEPPDSLERSIDLEHSPLKDLKTIVLSIDWEINDEDMTRFIEQVETLKVTYEYDKIILLFLQILGSLGKYVKTNKGNAHPNAIKVLNSVYTSLEKVILTKGISEQEKEKILLIEIKRFRELKQQVEAKGVAAAKKKEKKVSTYLKPKEKEEKTAVALQKQTQSPDEIDSETLKTEMGPMPPHEAFAYALEEIKQVLRAEFKALRAELKLWRDGQ
ncbi:MAG: hypothetical protein R6V46_12585 [Desulfatiglandaceae bacterium]